MAALLLCYNACIMFTEKMKAVGASIRLTLAGWWAAYKTSKVAWVITAVVVIVVVVVIAKSGQKSVDAGITSVVRADVVDSVVLSGRSQSASAVDLGFADQGRISSVYVKEGDKVTAGQVLASIDTSDLVASLENARAALTIARAGMTTNTTNLGTTKAQQDALVDSAYRNLLSNGLQAVPRDTSSTAAVPTVTGSYSGPEGDYIIRIYPSVSSTGASFDVSGLETGFANPVTSTPVALGSRGLYLQFPAGVNGASYSNTTWIVSIPNKKSSSYTVNMNAYLSAQATRDQVLAAANADLASTGTDQSIAQARVQQAQAAVDGILSQIARRKIVAPFNGVVSSVGIKPGQSTTGSLASASGGSGSSNTIRLISESDYEVVLKVPEISVAKVSVGQGVALTLDAYGKDVSFDGKVVSINPAETIVDGVPVYETKVAFTKADPRIRSGMTATATIISSRHDQVLALPASFVHADAAGSFVDLLNSDNTTVRRPVAIGLRGSDSMVEILSGLAEGDRVSATELK